MRVFGIIRTKFAIRGVKTGYGIQLEYMPPGKLLL